MDPLPPRIRRQAGLVALTKSYRRRPLALWAGAGVSRATKRHLGIKGWDALLSDLETALAGAQTADQRTDSPWERADALVERFDEARLQSAIVDRVRRDGHFQDGYKLLRKEFLDSLPTVRAIAAFCARLVGVSVSGQQRFYGRVLPNRRVPAVLSTNYDPFLEAAASSMFRTPATTLLKPVGARGSTAGLVGQIPVFHVHGYVSPWGDPDDRGDGDEHRDPFVDPVLTSAAHEQAWADRAASATIGPQVHLLRHYPTLFIGYSFRDERVNELLRDLLSERRDRRSPLLHFALVDPSVTATRDATWFAAHGVQPIVWENSSDIASVLAHVYLAGVREDVRLRGPIRLPELERSKHKRLLRTGREVELAGDDLTYLWTALEASRLGSLDRPPGWPSEEGGETEAPRPGSREAT